LQVVYRSLVWEKKKKKKHPATTTTTTTTTTITTYYYYKTTSLLPLTSYHISAAIITSGPTETQSVAPS
jgi:hypothetical protein